MEQNTFPTPDMAITTILVVSDMEKSKHFYFDILGAELYREYGGSSTVFSFLGSWFLLVTGGEPTKDKPDTTFDVPTDPNTVSHAFTIRVKDCQQSYEILKSRGAEFITPPYDWGAEIRCFFKDPDGHLFEISQA
jgi:catechol 2,3-dioxygenase-like lactoylglutathione lyase family enzyme